MTRITNHPKSIKGLWPRRAGCAYIEGEPKATEAHSTEELKKQGLVGVYVDMPLAEYYALPVVKTPQELNPLAFRKVGV